MLLLVITGLSLALGGLLISRQQSTRLASQLALQQATWQQEKADLEAALEQARAQGRAVSSPLVITSAPVVSAAPARLTPEQILAMLQTLREPGAARTRQAIYWLEELAQTGPKAVPAIAAFLASNTEVEFDTSSLSGRPSRDGRLPGEFLVPPSLRLGLFDVLRRIGGEAAENALAEALDRTSVGLEVACLTRALQELNPNGHRERALAVARALLDGAPPSSSAVLARNHRDYLFAVLSFYGDSSFATHAQSQLVGADNQIDRGALRYLQSTLGPQAVPMAAQVYDNPLLQTNSAAKEPLARLALNYVGADSQANEFYQKAINDPVLSRSHRKNLIEDLNENGFADPRNLTAKDLALIQNRISLIEQLAPKAMDQANAAAFQEAYKDLVKMRSKLAPQSPTP